jgi:pimeloyl-ACP methyl ester carboxylesterase
MSADRWRGAALLKGGKGYLPTPMGQVHYRDLGPRTGGVAILLLHMTPLSMIQYAEAQPLIAARGIRVVAIDTPGYGMSDPPAGAPAIRDFADNLVPVLDALQIDRVLAVGHHTGACIATAFAVRHPERVAAVVLHGVPIFNEEELAVRRNRSLGDRTPQDDGSHLSRWFAHDFPGPLQERTPAYLAAQTWFALSVFQQGPDIGHNAVYHYAMQADFEAIRVPGMIVTDRGDAMHPIDQRAAALRPDFIYREFSDDGTLSTMMRPGPWATLIADYYEQTR